MSFTIKIILLGLGIFAFVTLYACILAAATADEDAERMFREYEAWKRRHTEKQEPDDEIPPTDCQWR